MSSAIQSKQSMLLEIAWETCSQIGGIYTVIKTKAPNMVERWGDNYLMIGPYHQQTSALEFEEGVVPDHLKPAFEALAAQGTGVFEAVGQLLKAVAVGARLAVLV